MQQGPGRGGQENDGCSDHQVWLGPQPQASDRSMGQLMKLQARTGHPQHLWPCMLAKDELQKARSPYHPRVYDLSEHSSFHQRLPGANKS
jgi:hypothetical protein